MNNLADIETKLSRELLSSLNNWKAKYQIENIP
jgi:hypothetical protein